MCKHDQPYDIDSWETCVICKKIVLAAHVNNWTSGDPLIDILILGTQKDPSIIGRYFCWFDFTNFTNVKYILNGGFSRIYSATAQNLGFIFRGNNFPVILKIV